MKRLVVLALTLLTFISCLSEKKTMLVETQFTIKKLNYQYFLISIRGSNGEVYYSYNSSESDSRGINQIDSIFNLNSNSKVYFYSIQYDSYNTLGMLHKNDSAETYNYKEICEIPADIYAANFGKFDSRKIKDFYLDQITQDSLKITTNVIMNGDSIYKVTGISSEYYLNLKNLTFKLASDY